MSLRLLILILSSFWMAPVWAGLCERVETTTYNFTDISGTGTPILGGTDNSCVSIAPGFPFGNRFVCTNGLVSLTSGVTSATNVDLVTTSVTGDRSVSAVLWDDWNFTAAGSDQAYWEVQGVSPNLILIIQWNNACSDTACTGGPVTFQSKTYQAGLSDGTFMEYHWQDTTTDASRTQGNSATVGNRAVGSHIRCVTNANPFRCRLSCVSNGSPSGCNEVDSWSFCPVVSGGTGGCRTITDSTAIKFVRGDCNTSTISCEPNVPTFAKDFNDANISGYSHSTSPSGAAQLWHITENFPYNGPQNTFVLSYVKDEVSPTDVPSGNYNIGNIEGDVVGTGISIPDGALATMSLRIFIGDEYTVQPNSFDDFVMLISLNGNPPDAPDGCDTGSLPYVVASSRPGCGDADTGVEGIGITEWGGVAAYQFVEDIDLTMFNNRTIFPDYRFRPVDSLFQMFPGVRIQTANIDTCVPGGAEEVSWGWTHRY